MNQSLQWTISFLSAAFLLSGCGQKESAHKTDPLPEATVTTAPVEQRAHTRHQWLPGTVSPADSAKVAAKLMATVAEADFEIGQQVSEGDVLVRLKADEVDARVEQAEAAVAQVERNLEREQKLLEQKATTPETVRTLRDELRKARAQLAEATTMQGYTRVQAPFDGIITAKMVRRGDLARPGRPLLQLQGLSEMEVHVEVPDSLARLPMQASVTVESAGTRHSATLSEWSPAADPASRTRLAKLTLPADSPLHSGQYVRVLWPAGQTESLWIPAAALSQLGQLERVFVFSENQLQLQLVKTGLREGESLQIRSGLRPGQQVVLNPDSQLRDGQPATVQQ